MTLFDPKAAEGTRQAALYAALADFQSRVPSIKKGNKADIPGKDGKRGYAYDYADLSDMTEVAMPLLGACGLAFSAVPTWEENSQGQFMFVLRYQLVHKEGGAIEGVYPLPNPLTMTAQGIGSAITYARRYSFGAVTGLAPGGDDDDGTHPDFGGPAAGRPSRAGSNPYGDDSPRTTQNPRTPPRREAAPQPPAAPAPERAPEPEHGAYSPSGTHKWNRETKTWDPVPMTEGGDGWTPEQPVRGDSPTQEKAPGEPASAPTDTNSAELRRKLQEEADRIRAEEQRHAEEVAAAHQPAAPTPEQPKEPAKKAAPAKKAQGRKPSGGEVNQAKSRAVEAYKERNPGASYGDAVDAFQAANPGIRFRDASIEQLDAFASDLRIDTTADAPADVDVQDPEDYLGSPGSAGADGDTGETMSEADWAAREPGPGQEGLPL